MPLFLEQHLEGGFLAAPPVPSSLQPGDYLSLRGPFGQGFKLPASMRRLALASFVPGAARLLPLAEQAIQMGAEVALFCDAPPSGLPSDLEASPLTNLAEAHGWADFLGVDIPLERLSELREPLRWYNQKSVSPVGQVLVYTDIPCGGMAECGVCAIRTRRGWKLICKDGPVFGLDEVLDDLD